jgi:hypothetical protein
MDRENGFEMSRQGAILARLCLRSEGKRLDAEARRRGVQQEFSTKIRRIFSVTFAPSAPETRKGSRAVILAGFGHRASGDRGDE